MRTLLTGMLFDEQHHACYTSVMQDVHILDGSDSKNTKQKCCIALCVYFQAIFMVDCFGNENTFIDLWIGA